MILPASARRDTKLSDFLAQTCRLLAGPRPPTYDLTRWVFLRLLGMVYLVAFWSLGVQIVGLVGRQGILPIEPQLGRIYEVHGAAAYWDYPTLCWFNAGDAMLQILCWGGVGLSLLLIVGIAPLPVAALLWLLYLSLSVAGQTFLNFQWDALLLETGLLAIFYAPLQLLPWPTRERRPSPLVRWLLWLLLFKLIFLSGITKIASGDPTWADWTALFYHYETQPIPTWTSWYFHHLPAWVHKQSTAAMYFMEIAVPFSQFPAFADGHMPRVGDKLHGLLARFDKTGDQIRHYAFIPLLSWGHNIWNHAPLVLGAPALHTK